MGSQSATMKIACPGCRQRLDVTDLEPFTRINCPRCGGNVIAPKPFGTLLLEEPLGSRLGVSAYRALDTTLDREVLVKILDHGVEAFGEGYQALARKAAAVNHGGVVPIYSCGAEQGLSYLVTQFMSGGALAHRLQGYSASGDSIRQGVEWSRNIVGGLQAAAAQGVVHGAIAPCSILLDADGHAKLTDFGLDVLLTAPLGRAAAYESDVAAYLSPEVLSGAAPTTAADVFGLGAVLYHLLSGTGPCGSVADGEAAKRFWEGGRQPQPPRGVNAEVAPELSDMCMRMLGADPCSRPADFGEIIQLLTSACQARTVSALKPFGKRSRNLRSPVSQSLQAQPLRPPRPLRPQRDRWMNVLISGCILVALALGIVLYVRSQGYPRWIASVAASSAVPGPTAPTPIPAAVLTETATPSILSSDGKRPAALPDPPLSAAAEPTKSEEPGSGPADPPPEGRLANAPKHDIGENGLSTARRPRPDGLDFLAARQPLARYLRELPPDALAGERERIALIEDTKDYLIRLMKYVPFKEGKESDILLRSGLPVRGTIPYCNDNELAVRVRGDNALRMVPWRDLAIEQVIALLDFYIRVRVDQGQAAGGSKNSALRREVAEDCLRTAVLCDWYERPQEAARYARQALDADPGGTGRLKRLLPNVGL
jgi:serine/threonine-protein kinase